MTILRFIASCSVLTITLSAPMSAQSSFTGQNWRDWSSDVRLMYLVGWVDGREHGLFEATKEFAPTLISTWPKNPRVAKFASNVSVGQVHEGVNKFYEDYRNMHIAIRTALEIVDDESTGKHHWSGEDIARIRAAEARPKPTSRR
jgi:hypothetical protein